MADDGGVVYIVHSRFLGVQSSVYSVDRMGLSTQLWGAPVLSTKIEEV